MKVIIPMRLPLFLKSIFNKKTLIISVSIFPMLAVAQPDNVFIKGGTSFYNKVEKTGLTAENISANFLLGVKVPLADSFSISLDGFIGDDSYAGTTLDYTISMSDDFNLIGKGGFDFANEGVTPKFGVGIEGKVDNNLAFTMETVARNTERLPDYQFIAGIEYKFMVNPVEPEGTSVKKDERLSNNDSFHPVKSNQINRENFVKSSDQKNKDNITKSYRVLKGDTLWGIARKNNQNPKVLIDKNRRNIKNPDLIYPGEKVFL